MNCKVIKILQNNIDKHTHIDKSHLLKTLNDEHAHINKSHFFQTLKNAQRKRCCRNFRGFSSY